VVQATPIHRASRSFTDCNPKVLNTPFSATQSFRTHSPPLPPKTCTPSKSPHTPSTDLICRQGKRPSRHLLSREQASLTITPHQMLSSILRVLTVVSLVSAAAAQGFNCDSGFDDLCRSIDAASYCQDGVFHSDALKTCEEFCKCTVLHHGSSIHKSPSY
jgi:hypothetical protein